MCLSGCSYPEYVFARGYDQERCSDGVDNDGDGFADCDDLSCLCPAGELSEGWNGPVAVLDADNGSDGTVPSLACPATGAYQGSSTIFLSDPEGEPVTCGECGCALSDAECVVSADYAAADCTNRDAECSSGDWCGISLKNGACTPIDLSQAESNQVPQSLRIEATVHVRSEGCTGSAQSVERPEVSWRTASIRCGLAVVSDAPLMPGQEVRLPGPPGGFSVCIYREGDVSCPSLGYTKRLYSTASNDQRGCSCACAAPELTRCEGEARESGESTCDSTVQSPLSLEAGSCYDLGAGAPAGTSSGERSLWVDVQPTIPCSESFGTPEGEVEDAGPITYCCVE